jgi:hypothetical protein
MLPAAGAKEFMNISELKAALTNNADLVVRFALPNGMSVPAHAHVTEVARVDKHFVDCGGTVRQESYCRLQTWVADDLDHRLNAGKLLKILDKAKPLLKSDDLNVDVEHEVGFLSQFPVAGVTASGSEITLQLGTRHTACLAMDQCCPPGASSGDQCCASASPLAEFKPLTFNPIRR